MREPTGHFDFIHLEFGSAYRQDVLALLSRLASSIPASRRRLIVVDNAGAPAPLQHLAPFDEIVLLKGNNSSREFSGWDVGTDWLKRSGTLPSAGYVFSNDTIVRHRGFGIGRKWRFATTLAQLPRHSMPVICGEVDGLPQPISMPWGMHGLYASTYLFGLNHEAFELLTPFCVLVEQIDEMLSPSWPIESLCTEAMPLLYAQHIARWLHQPGGWYGAERLSEQNFLLMRAKAKMILLEQSLSARLGVNGGKLLSIYHSESPFESALSGLADRYERRLRIPILLQKLKRSIFS